MATLFVTSWERSAGKTAVCAGIGQHLMAGGWKVGFWEPLVRESGAGADSDASFMKNVLALDEPLESLAPAIGGEGDRSSRIKEAYAKVAPGKDVVLVEGMEGHVATALGAKVIVVEGYSRNSSPTGISRYKDFGENLLGVVINKVPGSQLERVSGEVSAQLGAAGVNLLGVLPEDRALLALTVGELAEGVQGKILNNAEKSEELVENVMLGAMYVDSGLEYFGRKVNKAVVVRGERSDMQLAALETATRCLVLSGGTAPIPLILNRAKEKKVPLILAGGNTTAVVASIEDALDKGKFSQGKKLAKLAEVMGRYFNFRAVDRGLGLTK